MKLLRRLVRLTSWVVGAGLVCAAPAATVQAVYQTATDVPVTAAGYTASGNDVVFTLNFAPAVGTELTVVRNTGAAFIAGAFSNLAQGQTVVLSFGGNAYTFVANYHGGSGNDLVLTWAFTRPFAWGSNLLGPLGDGTKTNRSPPTAVLQSGPLAGRTILQMAGGEGHSLALTADGALSAWGNNTSGQLGTGNANDSTVPVAVLQTGTALAGRSVAAIAAGVAHSLALCEDGTIAAWGYNTSGQLGDGSTTQRYFAVTVNTAGTPLGGRSVVALAAGSYHNLALCSDGTLVSWGLNVYGQLGDGTTTNRSAPVAVGTAGTPLAGRTVVAIAAGRHFSAALCSDGTLATWGDNSSGQLGDGTVTGRALPGAVVSAGTALAGRTVAALTAGGNYGLALCTDGTLAAWGYNAFGQLGDGTTTERHLAVAVTTAGTPLAGKTITGLAAGTYQSFALCSDGTLASWGRNEQGQLGDGSLTQRATPVAVSALGGGGRFAQVFSASSAFHTLALGAFPPAPEIALFTGAGTAPATERQSGSGTFDFAPTPVGASSAAQTFTVKNVGTADLTGLSVTLTGAQPADFAIAPPGVSTLVPGATSSFTVTFMPTSTGTRTATVQVASNDADENPFLIHLSGVHPTPDVALFEGDGTAPTDERQSNVGTSAFDPVLVGASGTARTFTVRNEGTADLTGLMLTLAGAHPGDFAVGAPSATTLAPGATATFTVTFTPTAAGARSASVLLSSNDPDENPFVLNVGGTAYLPGGTVSASYSTGLEVPVTSAGYTAAGKLVSFALNYAPVAGTELMVVKNTGLDFIVGTFDGLAHGQTVDLPYGGRIYRFVADYYGGSGNDLVLVWAANRAFGWGSNAYGALGDGTTTDHPLPAALTASAALAGRTVLSLAAGSYHALALCSDGSIAAWGSNANGQLGDGTTATHPEPATVPTAGTPLATRRVIALAAGDSHSLALCADGTLVAWGANGSGQLGDGTLVERRVPTIVPTAGTPLATRTVVAIAAGAFHNLVLCSDGTLVAWGQNNAGQVGDNSTTQRPAPVAVTTAGTPLAGRTPAVVVAGGSHNLVLCSDGTLVAWGQNADGQLGDSSTTPRTLPVAVTTAGTPLAGRTIGAVAAGAAHSLALCTDGTLAAWGWNTQGQLGDNSTTRRTTPVAVTVAGTALAGRTVAKLAGGSHHSLAVCTDGTLAAWGFNNSGQLGDGTLTQRPTAVAVNASALLPDERFSRLFLGGHAFLYSLALVARDPASEIAVFTAATPVPAAERQSGAGFAFADTPLGASSAARSFTIQNTGTADLTGLTLSKTGAQAAEFAIGAPGFPTTLAPGATATFTVTFTPAATGSRSATLQIASNDSNENPFIVVLTGATPTPELAVFNGASTAPVDERQSNIGLFIFDGVAVGASSAPQTFTLKNNGTADLTGLLVTKAGAHPADFAVNTGGLASTLPPGATTTFTAVFTPSAAGARTAVVQIASNDGDENPFLIQFSNDVLTASYATGAEVPLTTAGFTATGRLVDVQLNYAPTPGTDLLVVRNTGQAFIQGAFSNLAQGQVVTLSYGGIAYPFVASYFGGSGNDLVLSWANVRPFAWGQNTFGNLGDGSTTDRRIPVPITGALAGKIVTQVSTSYSHTLALCSDGSLFAWGYNANGGLGDNTTVGKSTPVAVVTAGTPLATRTPVAISASAGFNLVLCSDGSLVSWGANFSGQLGDNTTTQRNVPIAVITAGTPLAGRQVVGIATGIGHCLAVCADGTLVAWGANPNGQLGDNTTTSRSLPVAVATAGTPLAGKTVVALAAGDNHSLALCSDGSVAAWGQNWAGMVGDNTTATRLVPVAVSTAGTALAGRSVVAIAAGNNHSFALCSDQTLAAWGYNNAGQLGDSSTTNRLVPVAVVKAGTALAGRTVSSIMAGVSHSSAFCTDGTIACWGSNFAGQVGDNTITDRPLPTAVSSMPLAVGERYARLYGGATARHLLTLVASPPPPAPEIAVFIGASTAPGDERQSNASAFAFAPRLAGSSSAAQTFTLKNIGTAALTGLALSKTGPQAADFALSALSASTLAPGATATFTAIFTPAATGARNAVVQIASNDADENPFLLNVSGVGLTQLENWRLIYFGDAANAGPGADAADFDGDGVPNLVEFALGFDPTQANSAPLPQAQRVGDDLVLTLTAPGGLSGVTYGAEWSTTLQAGSWTAVPDTGTPPQHAFSVPIGSNSKLFLRLRIAGP